MESEKLTPDEKKALENMEKLLKEQRDVPPEIAEIVNDHFFEML